MTFVIILLVLLGPCVLLFWSIAPRDAWRDVKFVFDGRLLRCGLRFRRMPKMPRVRFTVRSLMLMTTLLALQQYMLLGFQGLAWWTLFALTSLIGFLFFFVAVVTKCRVPRRQQPERFNRTIDPTKRMPVIDVSDDPRFHAPNQAYGNFDIVTDDALPNEHSGTDTAAERC